MKKLTSLLALLMVFCCCSAQQVGNWEKMDSENKGAQLYGFVGSGSDYALAIVVVPTEKGAVGNPPLIRKYNEDFSSYSDFELPRETPMHYNASGFGNHVILNGYNFHDTGPLVTNIYENVIMCLSDEGEIQGNVSIKARDENSRMIDKATLYKSTDGNCLIVVSEESVFIPKPAENRIIHHIIVLNMDFEEIWRDEINFEKEFGKGVDFSKCQFDMTPSGKLLLIAAKVGSAAKKELTKISLCIFDSPGMIAHKAEQTLEYNTLKYKHVLMDDGTLYLCGVTKDLWVGGGNGLNQLFLIKAQTKDNFGITFKDTPLNKDFYNAYPEYSKSLKSHLQEPGKVLLMNDGLLYVSLYGLISEGGTYGYSGDISLIKFGFDGNIQWIKVIKKYDRVGPNNLYFQAFSRGTDAVLFYAGPGKKPEGSKPGPVPVSSPYCLVMAVVKSDGTLAETIVYDRLTDKTLFNLSNLYQVDQDYYIITGLLEKDNVKTEYLRTIEVAE